jgi:hypothetical protein
MREMFDLTGDRDVSMEYLTRANWEYESAVRLFISEQFAGAPAPPPAVSPEQWAKIQTLMNLTGDEDRAREFLIRAEWNEETAARLALRELPGLEE